MYFPVSGVTTSFWQPPLVAFGIAFISSLGGLSGSVLLLPFQMSVLGFTTPAVSPTNLVFNIVSTPGGIYVYLKEKRLLWPLVWILCLGSVPGMAIGGLIRIYLLPDNQAFKLFAGFLLLFIAMRLIQDSMRERAARAGGTTRQAPANECSTGIDEIQVKDAWLTYRFGSRHYRLSMVKLFLLNFVVGVAGGIYGIGGSAIVAPFLVSFFCLPVHTIAGATLAMNLVTSLSGCLFYYLFSFLPGQQAHMLSPDLMLGFLFGLGGIPGIYLGALAQKRVPASLIRLILSGITLMLALYYLLEFFLKAP